MGVIGTFLVWGIALIVGVLGLCAINNIVDKKTRDSREESLQGLAHKMGYPSFDLSIDVQNNFGIDTTHELFYITYEKNLESYTMIGTIGCIKSYRLERETGISESSNAMGRTLVGGILGGTVGAIAGAATSKKKQDVRYTGNCILTIYCDIGDEREEVIHRCFKVSQSKGLSVINALDRMKQT